MTYSRNKYLAQYQNGTKGLRRWILKHIMNELLFRKWVTNESTWMQVRTVFFNHFHHRRSGKNGRMKDPETICVWEFWARKVVKTIRLKGLTILIRHWLQICANGSRNFAKKFSFMIFYLNFFSFYRLIHSKLNKHNITQ